MKVAWARMVEMERKGSGEIWVAVADKCLMSSSQGKYLKSPTGQFPWCKYSHHGWCPHSLSECRAGKSCAWSALAPWAAHSGPGPCPSHSLPADGSVVVPLAQQRWAERQRRQPQDPGSLGAGLVLPDPMAPSTQLGAPTELHKEPIQERLTSASLAVERDGSAHALSITVGSKWDITAPRGKS